MKSKEFPNRIQFWTRIVDDDINLDRFNIERIDLKYPHIFWDNEVGYTNVLVTADPYVTDRILNMNNYDPF